MEKKKPISGWGRSYGYPEEKPKIEIKLQDFQEIADFIKKHDGKYTKKQLWEKFKKRK